MTKVGLMGGSFNPVHRQHLAIARQVRQTLALDEVRLVPVFQPVHKAGDEMLPFALRVELLRAAIGAERGLVVDDIEQRLAVPSFTIRTVRSLKEQFPGAQFHLVIGADSLQDLPNWRESDALIREIPLCVCARPGFPIPGALPGTASVQVPIEESRVSSRELRDQIRNGRFAGLELEGAVVGLLVEHDSFGCLGEPHRSWVSAVRTELKRLEAGVREHIESVARTAAGYAFDIGIDPREAYLAGLAHDLKRLTDPGENVRQAQSAGWELTPLELRMPMLAHGAAAAAFLAGLDPVPPRGVLEAVRRHTTLEDQEDPLARALVMGDFLDPSRGSRRREEIRLAELSPADRYAQVMVAKREKVNRPDRRLKQAGREQVGIPEAAGEP